MRRGCGMEWGKILREKQNIYEKSDKEMEEAE